MANLFQPGALADEKTFTLAKEFYFEVASAFNLQYGNVLLATSTKEHLQTVIRKGWPFFTNNSNLVKNCLQESLCDGIGDILQNLGIEFLFNYKFFSIIDFPFNSTFQMKTQSHELCRFTQSTWLLTRKGIFLLLHLFPFAPFKETTACLGKKELSLITL